MERSEFLPAIASAFATGYGWKIPGTGVPWALGGIAVVGAVLGWESLWRRRARRRKVRVKTDLGPQDWSDLAPAKNPRSS